MQLPRIFQENIRLLAEMHPEADQEDISEVTVYLSDHPDVLAESVEHVTKSEALEMMEDAMGSKILLADQVNPFMDVIRFRLIGDRMNAEKIGDMRASLTSEFKVRDLYVPQEALGSSGKMIQQLSGVLLLIFLGLIILVFVLIHQIMRMNIMTNRFMIRTMEIVGASKSFIMRPFVREASKLAAFAALIACGLFILLVFSIANKYSEIQFDGMSLIVIYVVVFTCLLSFIISLLSTAVAVNRQLGRGYDDL
jgi:cell division transport system permease protein